MIKVLKISIDFESWLKMDWNVLSFAKKFTELQFVIIKCV